MEFSFTPAQQEFREEWRDYLETELPEGWVGGGRHRHLPGDPEEQFELKVDWQRQLAADGWAGPNWPEAYGGMDLTAVEKMIYEWEMDRAGAPESPGAGPPLVGPTLIHLGTDWQKERFVPKILATEEIWSQGYSEPAHGSDIAGLECAAEASGDEFVINGRKTWNSFGQYADYTLLMTRTDTSGTKHEGITALIVDMDQDGIETHEIDQINGRRDFCEVSFDDAVAPAKHVVGEVGGGWDVIRTMSAFEQSWTRAFTAERRFNEILAYCQAHERDGTSLAEDPTRRRELAMLDTRIQAAKTTRFRHVSEWVEADYPGPEGSLDVVVGDELVIDVEEYGLDMTGPEAALWADGLANGERVADWLRWIGLWIGGGTGDIQRNIIGEQVLDLPKTPTSDYTHRPPSDRPDDEFGRTGDQSTRLRGRESRSLGEQIV